MRNDLQGDDTTIHSEYFTQTIAFKVLCSSLCHGIRAEIYFLVLEVIQGDNQREITLSREEKQIKNLFQVFDSHSGPAIASDLLWPTCDHHNIFRDNPSQGRLGLLRFLLRFLGFFSTAR